ncbi:hypothetical protein L3V83_05530 [Thiotrichales bacterium 19X7-9]|nr:hypothetical protein [Thiotrichales bacterium 19X7-9]
MDDFFKDLNINSLHGQRELYEELILTYNTSSKDSKLYTNILSNYEDILKKLNYSNRLYLLNNQLNKKTENFSNKLKNGVGVSPIVNFFPEWNDTRLFALRIKRLADTIAQARQSGIFKNTIDKTNPLFSIFGILWYIPRFLRHTSLIIKHTAKSNSFDYARKFAFEWLNDLVWITTGIMTFGMSTGLYLTPLTSVLGPGGIGLTVALYGFDCLNQAVKSYQKVQKLNRIIKTLDKKITVLCDSLNIKNDSNLSTCIEKLKQQNQNNNNTLVNQLKSTIEMRERIKLRKHYVKREQWIKLGVATGLFIGMAISLISGPIAPIVGASLVIATCASQYYAKKYYLPKQEIQYSYEPLEVLHNRLTKHCEKQIIKLQKLFNKCKTDTQEHNNTNAKLNQYQQALNELRQWSDNNRTSIQLQSILKDIISTSQIRRKHNTLPDSAKELKNILHAFDTSWNKDKPEKSSGKQPFNEIIKPFVKKPAYKSPNTHFFKSPNKTCLDKNVSLSP